MARADGAATGSDDPTQSATPASAEPKDTDSPKATEEPKATDTPKATEQTKATETPKVTDEPQPSVTPTISATTDPAEGDDSGDPDDTATATPSARLARGVASLVDDAQPPYLRWRVVDPDGTVVPGTTIELQGPGSLTATIEDNTGQVGYKGADRDAEPGSFLVKQLTDDDDAAETHDVAADETYKLRPAKADGFFVGEDADWQKADSSTSADDKVQDVTLIAPAVMTPFLIGSPDGATPPYVYWEVKSNSTPVGGSTFTIQGPRNTSTGGMGNDSSNNRWNDYEATVVDNTGQSGYSGLDLDPDPGEFLVKTFNGHDIRSDRRYRIQPATAPAGYAFTSTDWTAIPGQGANPGQTPATGVWVNDTYDFGDFALLQGQAPTKTANLTCAPNTFYSVSKGNNGQGNPAGGQLRRIVKGSPTTITNIGGLAAGTTSFNGIGIGAGGTAAYAYERTNSNRTVTIWFYDATNGWINTLDTYANSDDAGYVTGAVSLSTGDYYFGGFNTTENRFYLYKYNPTTRAFSKTGWIDTSNAGGSNGDMAFDANGNLYLVGSATTTTVYSVTAATLATASGGELAASESFSRALSNFSSINGMAFNTTGSMFLGNGDTVREYDSTTWEQIGSDVTTSLSSSTDLASCNSPANLTLKKNVVGRVYSKDQFRLSVKSGATESGSAITTGNANGVQDEQVGPLAVIAGNTYNVSETMASGSIGTLADDYTSSLTCVSGGQNLSVTNGNVAIPNEAGATVECTFTNKPLTTTIVASKTTIAANGTTTTTAPNWTFTASKPEGGNGTLIGTAGQTTSAGSPRANWALRFPNTTQTGSVTIKETQETGWTLTEVKCTAGDGTVTTHTGNDIAGDAVTLSGLQASSGQTSCVFTNREQLNNLTVTKTATTSYSQNYTWTIDKHVVGPDSVKVPGTTSSVDFNYQVVVTPSAPIRSQFKVTGQITVANSNPVQFTGVNIADSLDTVALPGASCTVTNGTNLMVPANGSITRNYECTLPNATSPTGSGTNTATATWNAANYGGTSGSATGTATANFANATVNTTNATVTLTDDHYTFPAPVVLNAADGAKTFDYKLTWNTDPGKCVSYKNTANIKNNQDVDKSDDATVEVCAGLDLDVSKVVVGKLTRTYDWSIDKSVDHTRLSVGPDGNATFNYKVKVTPNGFSDSKWQLSGSITVTNPNRWDVTGVTVTDLPNFGAGTTGIDCNVVGGTSATIPAATAAGSGSKTFDYSCTFTAVATLNGTNTATATWSSSQAGSPNASATGSAGITEAQWDKTLVNDKITVIDDKTNPAAPVTLGTWNWADGEKTFEYPLTLDGPAAGSVDRCRSYTNTAVIDELDKSDSQKVEVCAPVGNVSKSVVSTTQNDDFTWTVIYDVVVTNPSTTDPLYYTLKDKFDFGAGVTIVTAGITSGPSGVTVESSWDGTSSHDVVASNVTLPANAAGTASHTYRISVRANVDGTGPGANLACTTGQTGGFRNTTGITYPGGSDKDEACSSPSAPTVQKVAKGAVQDSTTGNWTITYDVVVTNPSSTQELAYKATDTAASLPSGVTQVTAWSIVGPTETDGHADLDTTWSGSGQFATGTLPAGNKTHTYTVTGVVAITGATNPADLTCAPKGSGGLINNATVTNGVDPDKDDACVSITPGAVTVEKSNGTATQLADFKWQIDYTITVKNTSGAATKYTLTDTPELGDGFTLVSGTWQAPAPTANKVIANGVTDTYTYRVIATFDPEVKDPQLTCDETTGGAFFNTVKVEYPGGSDDDTGCANPAAPAVSKTAKAMVQNPTTGQWTVSYDIVVRNTSNIQVAYRLTDKPEALPAGVTLVGNWSVSGVTKNPVNSGAFAPTAGWNGVGQTEIGTGALPAGTTHTFTVTGVVSVAANAKTDDLTCTAGGGAGGVVNTATVTNGVGGGHDSDCVTITPGAVKIAKSDGTVTQLADFSWQIDYTVTVSNTSGVTTTYTLTDVPDLGTGFSGSGAWVGTAPVANTVIANDHTDSYTYRVTATFDPQVKDPELTCDPSDGGAFFNRATVTFPGGTASDTGCAEPATPTVTKTAQEAVQNPGTGNWTLSYQVVVSNPSRIQLAYEATDTAAALPDGVSGGSWVATGPIKSPADAGSASPNASWAGSGVLGTGVLPAGASHTYTVSRTVSVAATTPGELLQCSETPGQGGGIWNRATVSNKVGGNSSQDCSEIKRPDVDITKTVASTTQLVDGTWEIAYSVKVTNKSTSLAAVYDLSDTLNFGGDIVVNSAVWTGPTSGTFPIVAPATQPKSATFATDRVLAPFVAGTSGVDSYTVTVKSTVDAKAWAGNTLKCIDGENPGAGGFLNTAQIKVNGGTKDADDCSSPSKPTILKTATSAVQDTTDASKWLVSYIVTVTGGEHSTYYNLSDTPGFAPGVTLGAGTAQRTDIAGQPVKTITSGVVFVTGQALDAKAVHTYKVTWVATLTDDFKPADGKCDAQQGAGKGFFNKATLTVGGIGMNDDDCLPVAERVYPTVTKTVTSTSQGAGDNWTITYKIDVNLAANEKNLGAVYNLTDTLDFGVGINVTSAKWSLTGGTAAETDVSFAGDSATLATNKTIASGATHTYTVTAIATITPAAVENETLTCKKLEGVPEAGGFLNTVLMKSGGKESKADACSEPDSPRVTKTGQAAVQDAVTGEWTLTYSLVVTNPSEDQQLSYTLTDTPAALPTGVTPVGAWSVSGPTKVGGGSGDLTAGWNGTDKTQVATGVLPVGAVHTYTVTGKVKVAASVPDSALECEVTETGRTGVWNSTTVTNGVGGNPDEDCIPIDRKGDADIVKTVESTKQLADGTWEITYLVTVTNTSKEVVAVYNLTDTLDFGGDIVVNSAKWTGPTSGTFPIVAPATQPKSATLATDRVLVPRGEGAVGVDTYTVTVNATVDAKAWSGDTLKCVGGEGGPSAGGFLNTASVVVDGNPPKTDDACDTPSLPLIEKTGTGAVQDPTDASKWLVSYKVKVTGGEHSTFYDLSDTPGFASGITLGAGTAQRTDIAGQPVKPIIAGANFVTGQALDAKAVHVYTVTWVAELTDSFAGGKAAQCGEVPTKGSGFFNSATITVGGINIDDDACIPVTERVYPTVTKTATSTTKGSNGNWTITYNVVAALAANQKGLAAKYDLTDTLNFGDGITVVGATWTGPNGTSGTFAGNNATLATGKTIASGASDTYTVTVVAAVSSAAFQNQTYLCKVGGNGPESGGFLNTALLKSGGQQSSDFDCTQPEKPTAEKPETEKPTAELPFTGSNPGLLVGGALLAVLAGTGLLLLGRRRRGGNVTH